MVALGLSGCEIFSPLRGSQQQDEYITPDDDRVVSVAVSYAAAPLLRELEDTFKTRYADVVLSIEATESRLAARRVAEGLADLAFYIDESSSMPALTDIEGIPAQKQVIAYDALVIVASANAAIDSLTLQQLRELYAGRVYTWEQLGGNDSLVRFVSREKGSATRELFEAVVMQGEPVSTASLLLPSDEAVADYVGRNPGAIGYVSMAYIDVRLKVLKLDNTEPSETTVRSGAYPLVRKIVAVLSSTPSAGAKRLLDLAVSDAGCKVAARHNVCPRNVK